MTTGSPTSSTAPKTAVSQGPRIGLRQMRASSSRSGGFARSRAAQSRRRPAVGGAVLALAVGDGLGRRHATSATAATAVSAAKCRPAEAHVSVVASPAARATPATSSTDTWAQGNQADACSPVSSRTCTRRVGRARRVELDDHPAAGGEQGGAAPQQPHRVAADADVAVGQQHGRSSGCRRARGRAPTPRSTSAPRARASATATGATSTPVQRTPAPEQGAGQPAGAAADVEGGAVAAGEQVGVAGGLHGRPAGDVERQGARRRRSGRRRRRPRQGDAVHVERAHAGTPQAAAARCRARPRPARPRGRPGCRCRAAPAAGVVRRPRSASRCACAAPVPSVDMGTPEKASGWAPCMPRAHQPPSAARPRTASAASSARTASLEQGGRHLRGVHADEQQRQGAAGGGVGEGARQPVGETAGALGQHLEGGGDGEGGGAVEHEDPAGDRGGGDGGRACRRALLPRRRPPARATAPVSAASSRGPAPAPWRAPAAGRGAGSRLHPLQIRAEQNADGEQATAPAPRPGGPTSWRGRPG